jgi:hypothetical protein
MNELELFCQFSLLEQASIVCFTVCTTVLLTALICAPRRDCFFFRWQPETRILALLAAPTLLIVWPILLYGWFLRSRGIGPEDHDFLDD